MTVVTFHINISEGKLEHDKIKEEGTLVILKIN
jgi:hypothetical protein